MGLFSFFEENKQNKISENDLPWKADYSIYEHVKNNRDSKGIITKEGDKLPDDKKRFPNNNLRWVSGGMDSILRQETNEKLVNKTVKLLAQIGDNNSNKAKIELFHILVEDRIMSFIDPVLRRASEIDFDSKTYLHNWFRSITFESSERGPVKFGATLLGLFEDKDDIKKLTILGAHEEFTLFVGVALSNALINAEIQLWNLAKRVKGWGRIHLVEMLSETKNKQIQKWFILEGYKNEIMIEYLALITAKSGRLKEELSQTKVNDKILVAASEIIAALINCELEMGPSEGIDSYTDAAEVIELYLKLSSKKSDNLQHFLTLNTIQTYLSDENTDWEVLQENGWTEDLKANVQIDIYRELHDIKWLKIIQEKKSTKASTEFWQINEIASVLNVDIWDEQWERLKVEPESISLWYEIMKNKNLDEKIDKIIQFAEKSLDLNSISTGVDDIAGFGYEYALHACIDVVLKKLHQFPGKGIKLISSALNSPVTSNRNLALKALSNWELSFFSRKIINQLKNLLKTEPNKQTKKNLIKLIQNKEIV